MRILIVGAGIGGMTLAALLHRRGVPATLVERSPSFEHAGYMLGLWPLGHRVLHGLGLYERFAEQSILGGTYEVRDDRGRPVKSWSMQSLNERFGPTWNSTRPQLVELLRSSLGDVAIRFKTSVENIEQRSSEVHVSLSDGTSDTYDLVVGADGLHSTVRSLVFGEHPYFHTGWGGWVWWTPLECIPEETFVEHWGAGRFVGAYPTRRGAGIFGGAPLDGDFEQTAPGRGERLRNRFAGMGPLVDSFLQALPDDEQEMFFWRLSDVRSAEWVSGRVVLLGDSAAGFLPTAGVGASMAMESAAALADELSRTNTEWLDRALALYVKRRKRRVEAVQRDSRRLAKMMFVRSRSLAALRNFAARFYSLESLAGSLAKALGEPI